MTCDKNSHSAREDGMHNDDKDVASDADRTRTSDPWDTRAPPTKGQAEPADMVAREECLLVPAKKHVLNTDLVSPC